MKFVNKQDFANISNSAHIEAVLRNATERADGTLHEHEVYSILELAGVSTPSWHFHKITDDTASLASKLPQTAKFVAKVVVEGMTHKTEQKGIAFNVTKEKAVEIFREFADRFAGQKLIGVLFAEQLDIDKKLGGEMMFGMYQDPFFGPCVSLGFGGVQVEHYKDIMKPHSAQVFIPAEVELSSVEHVVRNIPVVKFAEGKVRGSAKTLAYEEISSVFEKFQKLGLHFSASNPSANFIIEELEINPAVAHNGRVTALDGVARVRVSKGSSLTTKPIHKIKNLLAPKSVAIVGASGKNPANPSNIILKKFLKQQMPTENIFLIHPKEEEIEGIKCVKDLSEMLSKRGGKPVDCLVVGVPAKIAGGVIADSLEKCAAESMQIISAGFGETEAGKVLQNELTKMLHSLDATPEKRPVLNGPNTLGNIYHGSDTLFTPRYKSSGTRDGKKNCALICQSGAFMITRISDLGSVAAPPIAVSVGNQMDLSVTDFLEYMLDEKDIRTYGLYIEGLNPSDGIRLMKFVVKAKEMGKLVVVYRSGRTEAGMEAAKGHTAAMAGDYDMFSHLLRRAGTMVAETSQEFDDLILLTSFCDGLEDLMRLPTNKKIGVAALSNAGFEKCMIADHLTSGAPKTLELARYTDATRSKITTIFIEHGLTGFIDIHDILDLSPMMNDEGFEKVIRATIEDENTNFGVYSMVPETVMLNTCEASEKHKEDMTREGGILDRLIRIKKDVKKPFVVSIESGWKYDAIARALMSAGIPCFRSADSAARTVAKLIDAVRRDV